jgi:hypothetical protein
VGSLGVVIRPRAAATINMPRSMLPTAIARRIRRSLGETSCAYLSHTVGVRADGRILVAHGYGSLGPNVVAQWYCHSAAEWPTARRIAAALA